MLLHFKFENGRFQLTDLEEIVASKEDLIVDGVDVVARWDVENLRQLADGRSVAWLSNSSNWLCSENKWQAKDWPYPGEPDWINPKYGLWIGAEIKW